MGQHVSPALDCELPHPAARLPRPLSYFTRILGHGQELESEGHFRAAAAVYSSWADELRERPGTAEPEMRRLLGLAWMNRGNALQKNTAEPETLAEAIASYDEAISVFETLTPGLDHRCINHLGAAWLNRGHAWMLAADLSEAADSFRRSIAVLSEAPFVARPMFRFNLAGAWTNLAHVSLERDAAYSGNSAQRALSLLRGFEHDDVSFAAMSLRARRIAVLAAGAQMRATSDGASFQALLTVATDLVDDGLSIARQFEGGANDQLRPLASRLFALGAQLYGRHQTQFLAEFLREHLAAPAFAGDVNFRLIARQSISDALEILHRPHLHISETRDAEQRLATARALRDAQLIIENKLSSPVSYFS